MADLIETGIWEDGIYQIEETDVVRGGDPAVSGVSNIQPQQLANRTTYLYDRLGRVESVNEVELTTTDETLVATDFVNKIVALKILNTGYSINLDLTNAVDGTLIRIITENIYSATPANPNAIGNYAAIQILGGGSIIGTPHDGFETKIYLYTGENVTFVKNGTALLIVENNTGIDEVGEILYKARQPFMALPASGQLVDRSLYPRLWQWIDEGGIAIDDSSWLAISVVGPNLYRGSFSSGDGSTTFRMPDLRGMFLRGRDNGRGLDLDRFDAEGSYEAAEYKKHDHQIAQKTSWVEGFSAPTGHLVKVPVFDEVNSITVITEETDTSEEGGNQTTPINVAYTTYIKY